ncbi:zinc finger protein CONSTANS-LIKE 10-like isoform X4 [Camellia sinensis]|uniref:zinc finger protein CONSTANS-LIKE 10-like isoform X4 n=1 Tax=Camellia sinensis TaxID=4442 RepID=UPI00103693B0|nr:zinc finger protein CONSTANS-LIKE 10-like isoform X4 [Camellia sinensis]
MDKVCEFCMGLRPVIYCKADAAYLCLSCDAKVHSANALSNRHPRTPVCEACRYRPAHVRCSDHRMFMCHGCDCSLHKDSSQHQKQVISSFMGCPSAKDFAVLWGFELNKLENSTLQNQFVLTSCVSVDTGVKNSNFPRQSMSSPQTGGPSLASQASTVTSILGAEYEVGLSSQHTEVFNKGKQQQDTCIILQQIFDLERLQLTEGDKNSSLIRGKQTTDISSSTYDTSWKLDQSFQHSLGLGADPHQELNGEPLWQCRSPTQSFQDASVASSVYIIQSANLDKDIGLFSCEGCSYQIRPSYSSLPPSLTKFGAESNATDYMEGCFSPVIAREESPCNSPELKGSESNTEGNAMLRHKDKKVRRSGKQNRYASHKARTDSRKRVRGCSFS